MVVFKIKNAGLFRSQFTDETPNESDLTILPTYIPELLPFGISEEDL